MAYPSQRAWLPYVVLCAAPLFFSTNLVFGRFVAGDVDPFVLAFLRWATVAAILFPFAIKVGKNDMFAIIRDQWPFLVLLSFLGMGISGSGVYLGLQSTTATNATLIYSTAPILIILLERAFSDRRIKTREIVGISIALLGVATIVLNGDLGTILALSFNPGDVLIILASLSWAGYSILYRSQRLSHLKSVTLFGVIALFGAAINAPIALYKLSHASALPQSTSAWLALCGIIVISSLLAFTAFQFGIRAVGASVAGLFMYLMTPFGVLLAIIFLGETLQGFHLVGIAAVMLGVALATFPDFVLRYLRLS